MPAVKEYNGFFAVGLEVEKGVYHYIYLRQHKVKSKSNSSEEEVVPGDRTLFLTNLPVDSTSKILGDFFRIHVCDSMGGLVEKIKFQGQEDEDGYLQSGKGACHVVFVDSASMKGALSRIKKRAMESKDGIARYKVTMPPSLIRSRLYNFSMSRVLLDASEMESKIGQFMQDYDKRVSIMEKEKNKMGIPDDEGFVTIVRGPKPQSNQTQQEVISSNKRSANNHQLDDFYRFQIREKKKEKMNHLLEKFRNDQAQVAALKERRKFRPFK